MRVAPIGRATTNHKPHLWRQAGVTLPEVLLVVALGLGVTIGFTALFNSLTVSVEEGDMIEVATQLNAILSASQQYGQLHSRYGGLNENLRTQPQFCGLTQSQGANRQPFVITPQQLADLSLLPPLVQPDQNFQIGGFPIGWDIEYRPDSEIIGIETVLRQVQDAYIQAQIANQVQIFLVDWAAELAILDTHCNRIAQPADILALTLTGTDLDVLQNFSDFLQGDTVIPQHENNLRQMIACQRLVVQPPNTQAGIITLELFISPKSGFTILC